ncbi:hypothetical protein O3800_00965 [Gemella sanguinis]|uniref:hypothetical protein n=1 Tax=Gemella sanguinis TaxID=84135 RepID=UPI00352CE03F
MKKKENLIIKNKKLYFNDSLVTENCQYPFEKIEFLSEIGEGANGKAYKVRHKVLDIHQVVKVSKSNYQKNIFESIKNSSSEVSEVIAVVSDAGIFDNPSETSYSIMSSINKSISLSDWILCRDNLLSLAKEKYKENPLKSYSYLSGFIVQYSLSLAANFLYTYSILHKASIIHGDLNPKNILIIDSVFNEDLFINLNEYFTDNKLNSDQEREYKGNLTKTIAKLRNHTAGTIDFNNSTVKFIDLGTSKLESTDSNIGEDRDSELILDNVRKILKPFFRNSSLKNVLNVDVEERRIKKKVRPSELAGDMLRLIALINIMFGNMYNDASIDISDKNEITELNRIICGDIRNPSVISNLGDTDVFDSKFITAWVNLIFKGNEKLSSGNLINWDKLWSEIECSYKEDNDKSGELFETIVMEDSILFINRIS